MTHQATPPAPPHHDPTPQPPTPTTSGGPGTASPASTDPSPPTPPPSHEQPASNPPPPPPSDSGKQPAPAKAGEVRSYQQSAGFGGPLTITRSNGEAVSYFFGEKTQLSCYSVDASGNVVSYAACTKDRLKPGTAIARALHGPNQYGTDVWTVIDLIVPAA